MDAAVSTTSSAPTSTPTFYLKSSCDDSCLGHYAADDQIYSNLYTSSNSTFDTFYLDGAQLYDATTGTLCVASESGGSSSQFQCSNDLDYINGVAVVGGFGTSSNELTYSGSTAFYGCGVVDIADNYEPNGLNYFVEQSSSCQLCTFSLVTEDQCNVQASASTISTSYLAPAPTVATTSSASTTSTQTPTSTSTSHSTSCTTSTTTSVAPATTPKSCGTDQCLVWWLSRPDCYQKSCINCPFGTWCQQHQFWPWTNEWACLPLRL